MDVSAVILAAGRGSRMGARSNKVFLPLAGRSVLGHVLAAFACCSQVSEIVLVVAAGEEKAACAVAVDLPTPIRIVRGGEQRRDSALAGVEAAGGEIVLIHDGARPLVNVGLIDRVIDAAIRFGAAVPVVPEVDTLRYMEGDRLRPGSVDRSDLVKIQTPQGFRTSLIRECLRGAGTALPDDAEALLLAGHPVHSVPGDPLNIKVTRAEDLAIAEAILPLRR